MPEKSQIPSRLKLVLAVMFCTLPSLCEARAILWGQMHGFTGKALRDGLDFWAGGFLLLHHQLPLLFDHMAYQSFLQGLYGKLPYHLWSYPPSYALVAAAFGWLAPWHAVLAFDAVTLLLLALALRLAGKGWWFIAALALAPASLENMLRLGGALIGLATIKPQLGLVLPLYLLRRASIAFMYAALAAAVLAAASLWAFGPAAWQGFISFTSPAMSNVLLTGQPPEFAGGLISVFALAKPYAGVQGALIVQAVVSVLAVLAGLRTRSVPALLILSALASPYLHDYDLLGAALAVALLVEQRLVTGFLPGEGVLFGLVWAGPGLLPWVPQYAHAAPLLLVLLLASAWRRGGVAPCDSSPAQPGSPVSSAGRSPTPALPESTAPG
jgi:hypothetical protein